MIDVLFDPFCTYDPLNGIPFRPYTSFNTARSDITESSLRQILPNLLLPIQPKAVAPQERPHIPNFDHLVTTCANTTIPEAY